MQSTAEPCQWWFLKASGASRVTRFWRRRGAHRRARRPGRGAAKVADGQGRQAVHLRRRGRRGEPSRPLRGAAAVAAVSLHVRAGRERLAVRRLPGCSMFTDNIGQFAPAHLNARGVSLALSRARPWPLSRPTGSACRGLTLGFVSEHTFNVDFGITTKDGEMHASASFCAGARRFSEPISPRDEDPKPWAASGLLEATPYGRQETWETRRPTGPRRAIPMVRRHDEYSSLGGVEPKR